MKKFRLYLKWLVDYYFIYFLYNERKIKLYHRYMTLKYGKRYIDKLNNQDNNPPNNVWP